MKKTDKTESIEVMEIHTKTVVFNIVGTSPFIANRMSNKVLGELLDPGKKKTSVEKATTRKHDPIREFRDSPYTDREEDGPTRIQGLSTWFRKAIASTAVDIPGASKAQLGRLTQIVSDRVPIWGVPEIFMSVTRSADMNKTPDVRTRAILPKWATQVAIRFVEPNITQKSIANLLAAAGIINGIGDWRAQKGSGSYGCFRIVDADDPEFVHIMKTGGRKAQDAALADPSPYDDETETLLAHWDAETSRRGLKAVA